MSHAAPGHENDPVRVHWYLPTHGDEDSLSSAGARRLPPGSVPWTGRRFGMDYLTRIVREVEAAGLTSVLTPAGTYADDAWISAAALAQATSRLKFLVAFRPGLLAPTLAAQMASAFQRVSGDRLLVNVVAGSDRREQLRFGDELAKEQRYARAGEFLDIVRALWEQDQVDYQGEHLRVANAALLEPRVFPEVYFAGSSHEAIEVAGRHADVYLSWGEPPPAIGERIARVDAGANERHLRHGIRLHVITRDTSEEAWAQAAHLLGSLDREEIESRQAELRTHESAGQQRLLALHGGRTDDLEVYPGLWAGIGLVRGGTGTAMVGSHHEVADLIQDYRAHGVSEFILSGYPNLEEIHPVATGLLPELRRRGVLTADAAEPPRAAHAQLVGGV
ncbi:LLM class flavin-dependent oxidoreductase [Nocardioides humi]|uniref:LLM class flavin-dependent oxidoreductase n=1 Tax=Nocardioides humi TaxID=449461 RepID=A0ABN2A1X0_9ACTN|nr:LLM class flavin-dependent oxidoreductase [Nocardioides humi]